MKIYTKEDLDRYFIFKNFEIRTAIHAVLYLLENSKSEEILTIYKQLYYAEKYHIAKYGVTMLHDIYLVTETGPVPSTTYHLFTNHEEYKNMLYAYFGFDTNGYIRAVIKPIYKYISNACLESLTKALNTSKDVLNLHYLDTAWNKARNLKDDSIDFEDLHREAMRTYKDELDYTEENVESLKEYFENHLDNLFM